MEHLISMQQAGHAMSTDGGCTTMVQLPGTIPDGGMVIIV